MEFLSQRPLYSTDTSTKGFDLSSGKIWIYPENYPLREYQYEIVKSALYHNTLVCLPTGLGKTFIAAVVMYNFWRWYPQGKIVFLAPTKPLVAQQINACHEIMGIPSNETVELTGTTDQKKRQIAWVEHRVIFATPQVFQKDLEKKIVPSDRVKCVVVDEAHKALGKHSYCESIRLLCEQNQYFRVLALSATPGGKLDAVQEVVRNLHITHMELRDDRSPDIIPYINERKLDIVLVGLGAELAGFKDRYITIMDRHVRVLVEYNVLRGFAGNISKGRIFHIQKEWQQKPNKGGNHGKIMKTLMILMTMYHAYELLVRHGLRAFYNFYQNHLDKFWLNDEKELLSLLEEINYYLGPFPDVRPMPDGTVPEIPEDIRFGHNKFQKLKELLLRHFQSFEDKEEETRAIVFVEYRDIVNEVYVLLLQSRPLIRPQKFVGQAGQKQKQQKVALEDFRSNKVNVLISTSVGEEGLDVGEVDLIVCFDISQHSPIRLVQRMGRTGRKRDGHIVVLVTDGKEHQTLKSTMSRRDSLNDKVLQSSGIINALHEESPRMVPADFDPECQKMMMTIVPKIAPIKGKGKTKEPKKSRKRLDANSKTKNSKLAEPSTSSKPGGSQSSLMRFLKKPTEDPQMEVDDDFVTRTVNENPSLSVRTIRNTQSSQQSLKSGNTIKLSEVRLLSSDDAGVEFLTLCTMKKSENEQTYIDKTRTNPYHPSYYTNTDKNNNFFDFKVPDIKILDCLKNITDYILPSTINHNDDDMICEPTDRFNGCNDFYASSQNEVCEEHSKFEALLDESSSDSNVTVFQPKEEKNNDFPMNEQVDWAENIEGLGLEDFLDEWSEGSRTSVKNNEPKDNKPKETSCQSPNNILNKPGVFEDILDSSTDENDTDCNQQNINVESKCPEENIITENPTEMIIDDAFKGVFEDILNCSSESETDDDLRNINVNSKTLEEKSPTKNPIELPIDDHFEGTFEDILNSSSDNEADVNLRNINVNSETIEEKPTTKNPLEMSIDDQFEGNFEDILNSSSDTEIDFDIQNINVKSKTPEEKDTSEKCAEITISNETTGAFEDILNTSSDESETDCSLELEPDKPDASKKIIATKKPIDPVVENRCRDSIQDSNQICTLRMSVDIEIDKSTDLVLNCKQKTISQHLTDQNDRRNSKILSNPRELPTSDFSHDSTISPCNELTISQTIREVERMYSMKNVHNDSNVNNENEGEKEDERSTSPVFPDWPRASYTSRLSGNSVRESTKELILSHSKDPVDEIAESEEDIFGTDDLMVDSDFETQINNIEKSAAQNTLNNVDNLKSCDTSAKNTREEYAEGENVLKKISSNIINKRSGSPFDEAVRPKKTSRSYDLDEKVTEDLCLPARTSIRCELELDDCEWDSGETKNVFLPIRELSAHDTVDFTDSDWSIRRKNIRNPTAVRESVADTVVLADCNWSIKTATKSSLGKESLPDTVDFSDSLWSTKETKKSTSSSTKQSVLETIDLTDCDWDDEEVKKPTASLVKTSPPDIVNFDDCLESELVKNPTVSSVQTDLLLDDNDWSSDFETISSSVKPSTSFQENTENRDLPESIKNSLNNGDRIGNRFSKTVDTTGWISPKKPKLNLSLGKKLTKNICKSLSTKQNCPKPTESKEDSDSENEFAVGRLETTLTKQLDSDFFAKPDPVDTLTRSKPLGMSNPRRIIRGPLTLRRNDLNKLSINGLSSFAAPNKYTQQQGTRKTLSVGTGRQKSASLDLDTRKKKKRHRAERTRVRIRSEFIDDEAEVSSDGNHTPGSSGTDDDLQDFVSYTQHADDSVDMQAHYLQTLRSPHRPGAFHIRKPKSPSPGLEIYSQAVPDEPNSYLYDSFCVAEDDDVFEDSETPEEISILEEIEISLKRKKRKRVQSEDTRANPKRRVVAPPTDTSSSEDEFEKLRRQIHDESFILRNKTQ